MYLEVLKKQKLIFYLFVCFVWGVYIQSFTTYSNQIYDLTNFFKYIIMNIGFMPVVMIAFFASYLDCKNKTNDFELFVLLILYSLILTILFSGSLINILLYNFLSIPILFFYPFIKKICQKVNKNEIINLLVLIFLGSIFLVKIIETSGFYKNIIYEKSFMYILMLPIISIMSFIKIFTTSQSLEYLFFIMMFLYGIGEFILFGLFLTWFVGLKENNNYKFLLKIIIIYFFIYITTLILTHKNIFNIVDMPIERILLWSSGFCVYTIFFVIKKTIHLIRGKIYVL